MPLGYSVNQVATFQYLLHSEISPRLPLATLGGSHIKWRLPVRGSVNVKNNQLGLNQVFSN